MPTINGLKWRSLHNYKYRTTVEFVINLGDFTTADFPDAEIPGYVKLDGASKTLTISVGYAWDGATKAIDTVNFMRPSLTHDALYQLIRAGGLIAEYRKDADIVLRNMVAAEGMNKLRVKYVYFFVRTFGWLGTNPSKYEFVEYEVQPRSF